MPRLACERCRRYAVGSRLQNRHNPSAFAVGMLRDIREKRIHTLVVSSSVSLLLHTYEPHGRLCLFAWCLFSMLSATAHHVANFQSKKFWPVGLMPFGYPSMDVAPVDRESSPKLP